MRKFRIIVNILLAVTALAFIAGKLYTHFAVDTCPPVISCEQDTVTVSVRDDEQRLLSGVTAADDRDGDLTARVQVTGVSKLVGPDTAKVSYAVFDDAGNMGTLTRYVRYTDYRRPVFRLEKPLIYGTGETLSLAGRLYAEDSVDGDLTGRIRVSAMNISYSSEGMYTLTAQVTNSLGDTARIALPVIIRASSRKTVQLDEFLTYVEQGGEFDAKSHIVGDASSVVISGEVDAQTPGTYYVSYSRADGSGAVILTVAVE